MQGKWTAIQFNRRGEKHELLIPEKNYLFTGEIDVVASGIWKQMMQRKWNAIKSMGKEEGMNC